MVSSTLWIYSCFQSEWELIDRKFVTTWRVDFKEWKLDSQRKKKGNGNKKNTEKKVSEDSEVLEKLERALERQIEEEEEENIGLDQAMEVEEEEEEEVEEKEEEDEATKDF